MRYADGSVYEGTWVAGKREGKGRMTYADGGRYDGEFVADRREGKGRWKR